MYYVLSRNIDEKFGAMILPLALWMILIYLIHFAFFGLNFRKSEFELYHSSIIFLPFSLLFPEHCMIKKQISILWAISLGRAKESVGL